MDKNFVLNGNKLIAKFINGNIKQLLKTSDTLFFVKDNVCIGQPQWHSSWDWLIPVLNKIGIITNDNYYEKQHLFQDYYLPELDIKEVYSNVIEFIEWYNENK